MQSMTHSTASIYRRLTWQATIPLEIRLSEAEGEPSHGGGVERYYMQVPRHSYLPLILSELKENFVQAAVLEDDLAGTKEADWWFEEDNGEDDADPVESSGEARRGQTCPWHWPIEIIHCRHLINTPAPPVPHSSSSSTSPPAARPLRLILHLRPSNTSTAETLYFIPNTLESCRTQFVSQLKEADFVRWGNTRRITGLRRLDLESGWDAIVQNDFDMISRFQSKLVPLPTPPTLNPSNLNNATSSSSSSSSDPRPSSSVDASSGASSVGAAAVAASKGESVYSTKAVPVRFYLPGGHMHIQENVPPLQMDGTPTTVLQMLLISLTHLFPPPSPSNASDGLYTMAIPLMSGVELPPEAEVGWLSSCCSGPDGWLRIGIRLREARSA